MHPVKDAQRIMSRRHIVVYKDIILYCRKAEPYFIESTFQPMDSSHFELVLHHLEYFNQSPPQCQGRWEIRWWPKVLR